MTVLSLTRRAAFATSAAAVASACARDRARPSRASDLARLDAVGTASALRAGEVSPKEVIEAAIERAARVDPEISAVVTETYEAAKAAADAPGGGPWAGVPTFIKDLTDVAGVATKSGCRAFANYVAPADAPIVEACRRAGLVILGKSSTPEFGLTATTEPLLHPPTRNPFGLAHSVGGSSGGAAALVAAGVAPVGHASDGGGSIRIPASCCGLVGLKTSRGRTPPSYVPRDPPPVDIAVQNAVTRSVRDTAAFLAMIESASDLEPVGFVEAPSTKRRRIAFFTASPFGSDVDREVQDSVRATAKLLSALGHHVEEIAPPPDSAVMRDFIIYWGAGAARVVAEWQARAGRQASYDDFEPLTYGLIDFFEQSRAQLETIVARLISFEAIYHRRFEAWDAMLSPVVATPPPAIGWLNPANVYEMQVERLIEYASFTPMANLSGGAAISLPLGRTASGLPIGSQIIGPRGGERMLLELAYELEEAAPWKDRLAPLYG